MRGGVRDLYGGYELAVMACTTCGSASRSRGTASGMGRSLINAAAGAQDASCGSVTVKDSGGGGDPGTGEGFPFMLIIAALGLFGLLYYAF